MLYFLVHCLQICSESSLIMSQAQADSAAAEGYNFLICYQQLAVQADLANENLWGIRPKFHFFDESLGRMKETLENPARQSCMMEEDAMGKFKRVGQSTHRVSQSLRGLQRYLIWLKLRWREISER